MNIILIIGIILIIMKFLQNTNLPKLQELVKILGKPLAFVDLEATGLVHTPNFAIIEIGLVVIKENEIIERSTLVDPQMRIPSFITELTGINDSMVRGKKTFEAYNSFFEKLSKTHILCGYNSKSYDAAGIIKMSKQYDTYYSFDDQIDVRHFFIRNRNAELGIKSQKGSLTEAAEFYNVNILSGDSHRAAYDIALTALLAEKILVNHGLESLVVDVDKLSCGQTKTRFKQHFKMS